MQHTCTISCIKLPLAIGLRLHITRTRMISEGRVVVLVSIYSHLKPSQVLKNYDIKTFFDKRTGTSDRVNKRHSRVSLSLLTSYIYVHHINITLSSSIEHLMIEFCKE